ncbi:hypothetical protein J6590_019830 [Homalodisca vitripennis]|nr:hypothetical protein J6590_019830 [Homalodisca vitripennis]
MATNVDSRIIGFNHARIGHCSHVDRFTTPRVHSLKYWKNAKADCDIIWNHCPQSAETASSPPFPSQMRARTTLTIGSILGPVLFLVYISRRNSSLLRGKKLNSCIQYDVLIEETDSTKFLGMYLNRSFFRHLCSTEPFKILLLGCTKNGLVHPHIMYESRLWGSCSKYKFERVFRSQKKAVRIISKFKSQNSCRDAFRELGFLTLSCLYILDVALYCRFKCEFVRGRDVYQYGTRGRDNLRLHPHRTAAFKRLPSEVGVKLINKLPDEIKNLN